ncbi:hypothetical protein [Halodurantibacterium flavum]|uniref:Uncharacterized protein n=1 Tax=Halodurantibacterium flavum TaxID=1382802 RepID=A0ABW4S3H5_9RHOB
MKPDRARLLLWKVRAGGLTGTGTAQLQQQKHLIFNVFFITKFQAFGGVMPDSWEQGGLGPVVPVITGRRKDTKR